VFIQVVTVSVFLEVFQHIRMVNERCIRFVKVKIRKWHYFLRNISSENRSITRIYKKTKHQPYYKIRYTMNCKCARESTYQVVILY